MEVDEQDEASAPHQPVRGDRRIDPARQQTRHAAARPGRQAAGARFLSEEIKRALRQHLDVNRERRPIEIDVPPLRVLDPPAHLPLDLRRRERQPLVGARGGHAKRRRLPIAEIVEDGRRERVEIVRSLAGTGEVRDAEHARQPLAHVDPRSVPPELDLDAAHERANRRHVKAGERALQVPDEQLNEPRTIASLQRELFVVNDDRVHESGNWVIG